MNPLDPHVEIEFELSNRSGSGAWVEGITQKFTVTVRADVGMGPFQPEDAQLARSLGWTIHEGADWAEGERFQNFRKGATYPAYLDNAERLPEETLYAVADLSFETIVEGSCRAGHGCSIRCCLWDGSMVSIAGRGECGYAWAGELMRALTVDNTLSRGEVHLYHRNVPPPKDQGRDYVSGIALVVVLGIVALAIKGLVSLF